MHYAIVLRVPNKHWRLNLLGLWYQNYIKHILLQKGCEDVVACNKNVKSCMVDIWILVIMWVQIPTFSIYMYVLLIVRMQSMDGLVISSEMTFHNIYIYNNIKDSHSGTPPCDMLRQINEPLRPRLRWTSLSCAQASYMWPYYEHLWLQISSWLLESFKNRLIWFGICKSQILSFQVSIFKHIYKIYKGPNQTFQVITDALPTVFIIEPRMVSISWVHPPLTIHSHHYYF